MATEKPQLISTSQRLRVEQHIFWFEPIAHFLLFILYPPLFIANYTTPLGLFYPKKNNNTTLVIREALLISLFWFLITTNFTYFIVFRDRKLAIKCNPKVKTEAKVKRATYQYRHLSKQTYQYQPYTQADRLNHERILFWIERFDIPLLLIILFPQYPNTTIRAIWPLAATASLFFGSNCTYFLLFLESEKLYVQKNNTTSLKETNNGDGKGSQSCNSYASGSGSSVILNIEQAKLKEVKNKKTIIESKAMCDQQALEEAGDKSRKLETEYANLEASHIEESRKAIEQCKDKYYRMKQEEKLKKMKQHSQLWKEEFGNAIGECDRMKLKRRMIYSMCFDRKNEQS